MYTSILSPPLAYDIFTDMNLNKILRGIILTGIFIIPFIPLYVANSMFFPFITGKNFAFRIIVEIIIAAWIVLAMRDRSYAPRKSLVVYSVGAFLGVIAIADIFGANFYRSFWSNYERMEGLVALIHMCAYFLIVGSVLNTEKLWDGYFKTILFAGSLIVLYVFGQLAGMFNINQGSFRVDATFGNSTYLAVHALFLAFLALFYGARSYIKNSSAKWGYVVLGILYIFVLYKTATRGALIGFVFGLLTMATILIYLGDRRIKKFAYTLILVFSILVVVFIAARNSLFIQSSQTLNRFTQISWEQITKEPRLMVWSSAIQGFKEHPILGWGQDNFNLVFNKYYNPGMYSQEPWFDRAHDVFFDWLTAGGLLGLAAYLSIFGVALYIIWKKSDSLNFTLFDKTVFTGMFAAYFVQNVFVFDNLISYTVFFTFLAYLHHGSFDQIASIHSKPPRQTEEDVFFTQLISSIVLVGLVLCLYFVNVKPIFASRSLIRALSSQDLSQGLSNFKQVLSYNSFGTTEAREQLVQRAVNIRGADIDNSIKINYFNLAKDEIIKQIDSSPNDARHRVFATTLFSGYGLEDEALAQAEKGVEFSPKKQQIYFELISVYINRKEYEKAFEAAKYVHDFSPNFRDVDVIYAITAVYAKKDNDPAIQAMMAKLFDYGLPDDDRLTGAYAAIGKYDKVIAIWQKKLLKDPNNPQLHLSLAASLLANGQRAASIDELRVVIKLKPEFKVTAEHYISEIQAGRNP